METVYVEYSCTVSYVSLLFCLQNVKVYAKRINDSITEIYIKTYSFEV